MSARLGRRTIRSAAILVLLGLTAGLATMSIYMFNALQESAKAELHLTDFDMSLIQGTAVAIPLSLFAMLFGALADRVNRMRLLVAMVLVLAVATAGTAYAPSLSLLFAARVLAATAASAMLTIVISLASDFSDTAHRGRAMLVVNIGKMMGTASAFAIGAALSSHFATSGVPRWLATGMPWRASYVSLALAALLFTLPLLRLGEPARHESASGPDAPFSVVREELWQRRAYLVPLLFGQVGIVMADISATIWATPILSRNYGLQPTQVAAWIAPIILGAGVLGSLIGGYAADLGRRSHRQGGILLGAVAAAAIAIPAGLFPIMPGVPAFAVALAVFLLCGNVAGLALIAVITVDLPNEVRGLSFGAFLAVGGLVGYGIAPTLVSLVSSWLGGERHLATALALVGTLISVLVFLSFLVAARATPRRDIAELARQPVAA